MQNRRQFCEHLQLLRFPALQRRAVRKLGRFDYMPVLREKGVLLPPSSAHQARIHVSWPVSYVRRLHARSSSIFEFCKARDIFLQRLAQQCFPRETINHVIDSTNYYMPYCNHFTIARKCKTNMAYCVLPFHPVWQCLNKELHAFCDDVDHRELLEIAFGPHLLSIAVSWKQQSPPFGVSLVKW